MPKSLAAVLRDGLRGGFRAEVLRDGIPLTDYSFWRAWGNNSSFTGDSVSVDGALRLSTVWSCTGLISETIATLPFGFYERKADGSRVPATSHELYEILHNQPNADQTAVVFWAVVVASMLLWGNAYVEKLVRANGTVLGLRFLYPSRVTLRRLTSGAYDYVYHDEKAAVKDRVIPETRMMHIPAFGTDGICGLSPIAFGANVFSTAIETDKSSAQTFKGAMRSPGILTMDMVLSKQQREDLRAHVKSVSDTGGVMVVEKGTGFQKLGFDPVSAELLASRAWNVEEICRWYGVDPSMIGHGGKDSNWGTGLEQKMLWFVTFTLRKLCVRIEQAVRKSLLTPVERVKYFAEFSLEGLLRGDSTARATFYSTMTQNGVMTRDDCRGKENLPAMGGNAAVLTVQSNMLPLNRLGDNIKPPQDRRATDQANLDDLRNELRTMSALLAAKQPPAPAPVTNIDARTNVTTSPQPANNIVVNTPEQKPINIDARTTINPAAAPDIVVNNAAPQIETPDVHVEVAAPVVNVAPPSVTMNIEASDGEKTTTYERDPKTKEIVSSTTKRK